MRRSTIETKNKILIVDDEPAILKILIVKLRISGYDVITALRGQEALELIDSARPDLLLLDVIMPEMDGFTVLQELRTRSNLPVIIFSASPGNKGEALRLGADDFIHKPFDPDDVVQKIRALLTSKE